MNSVISNIERQYYNIFDQKLSSIASSLISKFLLKYDNKAHEKDPDVAGQIFIIYDEHPESVNDINLLNSKIEELAIQDNNMRERTLKRKLNSIKNQS